MVLGKTSVKVNVVRSRLVVELAEGARGIGLTIWIGLESEYQV